MRPNSHTFEFSVDQPHLYSECANCQFIVERIISESDKSLEKYGELDVHKLTVTCEGNILDQKVMWASHDGIRFSHVDVPGLRVDGIMLSGGELVNCPAMRK